MTNSLHQPSTLLQSNLTNASFFPPTPISDDIKENQLQQQHQTTNKFQHQQHHQKDHVRRRHVTLLLPTLNRGIPLNLSVPCVCNSSLTNPFI